MVGGEKVMGDVSGRRYARASFIAGQLENQIIAPFCYQGTCDTGLFNFWLANLLLPTLGPDYTLIIDNAAFHKSEKTRELIKIAGCNLLFSPPYSLDLNPIEKFLANIKTKIKQFLPDFSSLSVAVDYEFMPII